MGFYGTNKVEIRRDYNTYEIVVSFECAFRGRVEKRFPWGEGLNQGKVRGEALEFAIEAINDLSM